MSEIVEISTRVNVELLRALIAEEVAAVLQRLVQRPIREIAAGSIAAPEPAPTPSNKRGRPRKNGILRTAAPPVPVAEKSTSPAKEAPGSSEGAAKAIVEAVTAKPGIRGVELRGSLGWDKSFYSYHMKLAQQNKLIAVKGSKAAASYFPNERGIEKFLNGSATAAN